MAELSSEEYLTVLSFFEKALEEEPERHSYWYDIAFCKGRLGHWNEALVALDKASESQSEEPAFLNLLGHTHIKLKQYDEAVGVLKKALVLKPRSPNLLYKLAAAYFGKGNLKSAKETIIQIIKLTPNFSKAHFGLGLVCYYLDDTTGYKQQIAALDKSNPELAQKLADLQKITVK